MSDFVTDLSKLKIGKYQIPWRPVNDWERNNNPDMAKYQPCWNCTDYDIRMGRVEMRDNKPFYAELKICGYTDKCLKFLDAATGITYPVYTHTLVNNAELLVGGMLKGTWIFIKTGTSQALRLLSPHDLT